MFSNVEMARDVAICSKHLNGRTRHQQILSKLLQDLVREKACQEHGYYLGITALKSIGNCCKSENEETHQSHIHTFLVSFTCRTFLPAIGDVLQGIVHRVCRNGVFIKSGPLKYAYLSLLKMPGYHYVRSQSEGKKPCFLKEDLSKIGVGVVLRFQVLAVKFKEGSHKEKNEIYTLATIEGDDNNGLGPISLTGLDKPYM